MAEQSITSSSANGELWGPVGLALTAGPAAGVSLQVQDVTLLSPCVSQCVPSLLLLLEHPGVDKAAALDLSLNPWAPHKCPLFQGLPAQESCRSTQGNWDTLSIPIQQGGKAESTETPTSCEERTRSSHVSPPSHGRAWGSPVGPLLFCCSFPVLLPWLLLLAPPHLSCCPWPCRLTGNHHRHSIPTEPECSQRFW